MLTLGRVHFASALLALAAGAWVLWRPKGTATHRRVGWTYAVSMLVLNVTALLIYRLTGTFGPFHVAALASLGTLTAGIVPVWRRRPAGKWLEYHYFFMAYSYLGLIAAAVAETSSRVEAIQSFAGGPTPAFWAIVALVSIAVMVVGGRIVRWRAEPTLRPFRRLRAASAAARAA
jgi:uncharacterized membrane protein